MTKSQLFRFNFMMTGRILLLVVAMMVFLVLTPHPAQGQTYSVLYSFKGGPDGESPEGTLARDGAGNLFGITCCGGTNKEGTVFKLNSKTGRKVTLHSFTGTAGDGKEPTGGLVRDAAGNLYGTTRNGGAYGTGGVFKVERTGTFSMLYSFCSQPSCADGSLPSGLIRDPAGNLYGIAEIGGAHNNTGVVFKVDATGNETVLYSFCNQPLCADGAYPIAGLVGDAAGNLYGVTSAGGANNLGVVFKLDSTGTFTVLYSWDAGVTPYGLIPSTLSRDAAGNLYGTTRYGGDFTCDFRGCGTVYKIDASGTETLLHTFIGGDDGAYPNTGVIEDAAGNLYGTEMGMIFKLDPTGNETVLYAFCSQPSCADGFYPLSRLIQDSAGNFYGTASHGGLGFGVVFKISFP
ncbi:MAG TPA: choice-of-anchor tandem repeat GloVer-containing protein [Terriglobales bacterium]|jgi:uncharacterized repeat protein (TIGR03803 family)